MICIGHGQAKKISILTLFEASYIFSALSSPIVYTRITSFDIDLFKVF